MQRWQCPIYNGTEILIWSKMCMEACFFRFTGVNLVIFISAQVSFAKKPLLKIISFKNYKHWYLVLTWSDKAFKGTIGMRTSSSFDAGLTEITLTVPLIQGSVSYRAPGTNVNIQVNQVQYTFCLSLERGRGCRAAMSPASHRIRRWVFIMIWRYP